MTSAKKPSAWKVAFEKYRDAQHAKGIAVFADDFAAGHAAALAAVEEQMPGRGHGENPRSQGWNQVVDYMSERIAALRSEET